MGLFSSISKAVGSVAKNPLSLINPIAAVTTAAGAGALNGITGGGGAGSPPNPASVDTSPLASLESAGNQAQKDRLAALAARQQQIGDFSNSLATARQNFLTQTNQLQQDAFKRFAPQAEAQFAGRGLDVTGGAFQSALAQKAAEYQNNLIASQADQQRQDLMSVQNLQTGLFPQQLGITDNGLNFSQALANARLGVNTNQANAQNAANTNAYNAQNAQNMAQGQLFGSLINTGLSFGLPALMGPAGAVAAPLAKQALFPQGQAAPVQPLAANPYPYGNKLNI